MANNDNTNSPPFGPPEMEENGRQYQGFRRGIYPFPCDEVRSWWKASVLTLSD